jgi:hypothetical protein
MVARELFPLFVCARHVTPQNIRFLVEQNGQMTGRNFAVTVRDHRCKAVRLNERVDRMSIFYAIERRDVHQRELMSDK